MEKSKYMFQVAFEPKSTIIPFERNFIENEIKDKSNYIEFEDLKEYIKKYPGCYGLALDEESKPEIEKVLKTFGGIVVF